MITEGSGVNWGTGGKSPLKIIRYDGNTLHVNYMLCKP